MASAGVAWIAKISPWHNIVIGLGGEFIEPRDGLPCAKFMLDGQIICYSVFPTFYGEDAKPAYVIQNGVCTPLFDECP
jgi:hypothetical protein